MERRGRIPSSSWRGRHGSLLLAEHPDDGVNYGPKTPSARIRENVDSKLNDTHALRRSACLQVPFTAAEGDPNSSKAVPRRFCNAAES